MDQLLDLFCFEESGQFKLVYLFQNSGTNERLETIVTLEKDLRAPSLTALYESANWLERECFDLFGVRFDGHPNLKRLLLYPEFAGYPLRKNYPIDKEQPRVPIYG